MTKTRLASIVSIDVFGFTKLMEDNPKVVLAALNLVFDSIIKPEVEKSNGRVVKLLGDGALLEFGSAGEAIDCCIAIQKHMLQREPSGDIDSEILLRIGIHVGDVIAENNDIFGDAVNIASRLQEDAVPGCILLSKTVASLAGKSLDPSLNREGYRRFKNVSEPIETLSVNFSNLSIAEDAQRTVDSLQIMFCKSSDGQTIAWSSMGEGYPIVKAPNWIGHLELDWRNPGTSPILRSLSSRHRLIYFDARGNGLSDWEMETINFELMVDDLEAIFNASGIDRAPIVAKSQGCAIAAAFAVRAPERVSSIIMIGGYPLGRAKRNSGKDKKRAEALQAMMRAGWDDDYPSLRDLMAELIIPGASREDRKQYAQDMRHMISPENLGRYREVIDDIDIEELLTRVTCPCLVMHSNGDKMQPIEQGRKMAAGIADARFVPLDSNNH